jgi:hypothetical protein
MFPTVIGIFLSLLGLGAILFGGALLISGAPTAFLGGVIAVIAGFTFCGLGVSLILRPQDELDLPPSFPGR